MKKCYYDEAKPSNLDCVPPAPTAESNFYDPPLKEHNRDSNTEEELYDTIPERETSDQNTKSACNVDAPLYVNLSDTSCRPKTSKGQRLDVTQVHPLSDLTETGDDNNVNCDSKLEMPKEEKIGNIPLEDCGKSGASNKMAATSSKDCGKSKADDKMDVTGDGVSAGANLVVRLPSEPVYQNTLDQMAATATEPIYQNRMDLSWQNAQNEFKEQNAEK